MAWFSVLIAYLCGSIPFGLLLGFLCGKDIRNEGSGNIGATNVLRVCGWKVGAVAFLLDVAKGVGPVLLAQSLANPDAALIPVLAGLATIVGHTFPVWLRFKGGKGVATSAGVVGALMPVQLAVALGMFIAVLAVSRYVSLGSLCAAIALVFAQVMLKPNALGLNELPLTLMTALICTLVYVRHWANLHRLLDGTEPKLGQRKDTPDKPPETPATTDTPREGDAT